MNRTFNYIVLSSLILTVIYWFLPLYDHNWLNDDALNLLDANGWGSYFPYSNSLYWLLLFFWVLTSIGLYLRISIARTIFLTGTLILSIANFGWGFLVLTSIESGLNNIITLLDGSIITMAYLTSVSMEFEKTSKAFKRDAEKQRAP